MASRILVYRIGSLGDNLIVLPSIWAVKDNFSDSELFLLNNKNSDPNRLTGRDVLGGTGLFAGFFNYPFAAKGFRKFVVPFQLLRLLAKLRAGRFDVLVYLAPSQRNSRQIARDRFFFRLAGIAKSFGMEGFPAFPAKIPGQPLQEIPREADLLLRRLETSGLTVPLPGMGKFDLGFNEVEQKEFNAQISWFSSDEGRPWIGIGPGSNMPVKIWPEDRYREVVHEILKNYKAWPVVLGGLEDEGIGERLVKAWGCGYNLAGKLSVRQSALALRQCKLYLGNDTGTMHLAATVGIRCVAVFSSRTYPGQWYPYGDGHHVFRKEIECEGCELVVCAEKRMECILSIEPKEVLATCLAVLDPDVAVKGD